MTHTNRSLSVQYLHHLDEYAEGTLVQCADDKSRDPAKEQDEITLKASVKHPQWKESNRAFRKLHSQF